MKLASLRAGGRDGTLVVVSRDLARAAAVPEIARTLQAALDDWAVCAPRLREAAEALERGRAPGVFALDTRGLAAPLPRAFQWADGSAYLTHVELVRRARGAELPPEFLHDPLMYQGGSDAMLGPCDPIEAESESFGIDYEAEVAAITDDVPMGSCAEQAAQHIQLLALVNDVSLRNLIPAELAKGFGFFHGKPSTAFSPVAVTPDELEPDWRGSKLQRPLHSWVSDVLMGAPDAGADMQFDFAMLVAHAARTRRLGAGSIIGSGTVSNRDASRGVSCLAEKRVREQLESGAAKTPFLAFGDRVRIEMFDREGRSIFGAIEQRVVQYAGGGPT